MQMTNIQSLQYNFDRTNHNLFLTQNKAQIYIPIVGNILFFWQK